MQRLFSLAVLFLVAAPTFGNDIRVVATGTITSTTGPVAPFGNIPIGTPIVFSVCVFDPPLELTPTRAGYVQDRTVSFVTVGGQTVAFASVNTGGGASSVLTQDAPPGGGFDILGMSAAYAVAGSSDVLITFQAFDLAGTMLNGPLLSDNFGNLLGSQPGFGSIGLVTQAMFTTTSLVVANEGSSGPGAIGSNYCAATNNSTGTSGDISAFGETSIAANDITLTATSLPLNQFGLFVASDTQGFVTPPVAMSNGNLCLGGTIGRYQRPGQILSSGTSGTYSLRINVNTIPEGGAFLPVNAGVTVNFQSWHRDSVGLGSNFTNGLEIVLTN